MDFIKRPIRHIPEKHYKMIRYSGFYARHREIDKKLHWAVSSENYRIYSSFHQWRTAILPAFGYAANPGSGDYRPSKVTTNVVENRFWIAFVGFGIDIENNVVSLVTVSIIFSIILLLN